MLQLFIPGLLGASLGPAARLRCSSHHRCAAQDQLLHELWTGDIDLKYILNCKPCSGLHLALGRPGLLQPHGGRVQLRPGAAGHELRHGLLVPGR